MTKICKDCEFYNRWNQECRHPSSGVTDIVTGKVYFHDARDARYKTFHCKSEALHFQPKSKNWLRRALKI